MSAHHLRLVRPEDTRSTGADAFQGRPLGEILLAIGAIAPDSLRAALGRQSRATGRLGELLLAEQEITEAALASALALQHGTIVADLGTDPPERHLIDRVGPSRAVGLGLCPWKRAGAVVLVATARPDDFAGIRPEIEARLKSPVRMVVAPLSDCRAAVLSVRRRSLAAGAEHRVSEAESCRSFAAPKATRTGLALLTLAAIALAVAPVAILTALTLWAALMLVLTTTLRLAAAAATLRALPREKWRFHTDTPADIARWPKVSLLVPLYRERDIATDLVARLSRLDYPAARLDICLILEEDDTATRDMLGRAPEAGAMRRILVPHGQLKTKPRAMNYALDFTDGEILGIYDAEDAPAPDQIRKIVRRFHERPADVACLQGVLDFYNTRTNWLSRCFAVDYAVWFRLILPGLARLGLPVPLGGTTVFFRRAALEAVGAWDAQNVTEDADLGIRLARHGYRTELVNTVTEEEANCRPWPWVRQRSRWLKGYAMTWATHSRRPRTLLRDLGPWRFAGFQVLFLGALTQFLLAPLLWSFWLLPLGLPHPVAAALPPAGIIALIALFILSEVVNITLGLIAVSSPRHRFLMPWVPTLHAYFPLGSLAAYKALAELFTRPFWWDKTAHGAGRLSPARPWRRRRRPA